MDAPASNKGKNALREFLGLILNVENPEFPCNSNKKSTVIKYAKIPEFHISDEAWCNESIETSNRRPKVRRVIAVEDPVNRSSRSLKSEFQPKQKTSQGTNRKFVSISEDVEQKLEPKFSHRKNIQSKSRSTEANIMKEPKITARKSIRSISPSRNFKENKLSAKSGLSNASDHIVITPYKNRQVKSVTENIRQRNVTDRDLNTHVVKSPTLSSKPSLRRNYMASHKFEKNISESKKKTCEANKPTPLKRVTERYNAKGALDIPGLKLKEGLNKKAPIPVIFVPLEEKYRNIDSKNKSDYLGECATSTNTFRNDVYVNTDPPPEKLNKDSNTDCEPHIYYKYIQSTDVQTEVVKEFESLNIPNVTLTKDNSEIREDGLKLQSTSLPNLQVPALKITTNNNDSTSDAGNCNPGFIISRATLTYTTKQKINLEVVGSNENAYTKQTPSPLAYPVNVVSLYKKEIKSNDVTKNNVETKDKSEKELKNCINELKSLDCSYVSNSNKLMKPSDIISTIRVNNDLFHTDYFCEQFQRELNFIDSFFESLQYLENYTFTDSCFRNNQLDSLVPNPSILDTNIGLKISNYELTKFENGESISSNETMASKNLFLLNRLIRNEQKRAKNLLFVLKRREDALKDFTKSQILYLENKKKKENTDITALKKKQRGALLKLQHECGEMQRMRKALLTLSEKRKVALLKTKKDLELKLKSNVDVEQIILGKKKVKRNTSQDRTAPLKCFDLSSSGCEDSTTSRHTSEAVSVSSKDIPRSVCHAEKSIQTGDGILCPLLPGDRTTFTTDENFVAVDGGYLNILFHNLSLPQIFSDGKQYEVNKEALKNIINSSNSKYSVKEFGVIEKLFMDQIKNPDMDKSSTPSTARSLVEEFDQYYKSLREEEKSADIPDQGNMVCEITDVDVQTESMLADTQNIIKVNSSTMTMSDCEENPETNVPVMVEDSKEMESPTGPLPVPAGAAAVPDPPVTEAPIILNNTTVVVTDTDSSISSPALCDIVSSMSSLTAPVNYEAEELRRQQLAIEKEIKELEQQQCRLLVVREIPDKPPPPYTPPVEIKIDIAPRKFHKDGTTDEMIHKYITDQEPVPASDVFDVFVHDFCQETLNKQMLEQSDKPWDSCNLLPPRPSVSKSKLAKRTSDELTEVLSGVSSTALSGFSSRRSDHIDEILFAEWRRVEPEWTTLHADEAIVKNQIFENIFQRILTETVDEYKKTVKFNEN